ncbi:MAG: hypothetical protein M3680_28220 [Myxococcota bacterium]|nr:hypothetical protein [Myxococcota bacterium]
MVGPGALAATELSRETGIPQPTLSRWLRGAASLRLVSTKQDGPSDVEATEPEPKRPQDWSPTDRMSSFSMHETSATKSSESCFAGAASIASSSTHGVSRSMTRLLGRPHRDVLPRVSASSSSSARSRARDKALAETAALLVLQKELHLLLPQADEDDDTDDGNDK